MIKKHTFYYLSEIEDAIKDTSFYRSDAWRWCFFYAEYGELVSLSSIEDMYLDNAHYYSEIPLSPLELIRYLYSLGIDKKESLIYVDL